MRMKFTGLPRLRLRLSPSCRSRVNKALHASVGALTALFIGLGGASLFAQWPGGSGVLPVSPPFTAGGTLTGPLTLPGPLTFSSNPTIVFQDTTLTRLADGVLRLSNQAITDFGRLTFGPATGDFPALKRSGANLQVRLADESGNARLFASNLHAVSAGVTSGSGTGITVNEGDGLLRRTVYKVTIDRTAFVCAATTCDLTIGTLPAKTSVLSVYAHIETTFACTATCTSSTLSMQLGSSAGGTQYLASFDADAATSVFGDADAELGTTMTRAAAIQGGNAVPNFSSTTAINLRLTSGTGNIGNGSATNLSQGSVTVYLVTERLP